MKNNIRKSVIATTVGLFLSISAGHVIADTMENPTSSEALELLASLEGLDSNSTFTPNSTLSTVLGPNQDFNDVVSPKELEAEMSKLEPNTAQQLQYSTEVDLVIDSDKATKAARRYGELTAQKQELTLRLEIAEKQKLLKKELMSDEFTDLKQQVKILEDELSIKQMELVSVTSQLSQVNQENASLKFNITQLIETTEEKSSLNQVYLTQVSGLESNLKGRFVYLNDVFIRGNGELVGESIKVKSISKDLAVIQDGDREKHIYLTSSARAYQRGVEKAAQDEQRTFEIQQSQTMDTSNSY
ncbi:hypothetical protein AB6D11_02785 [Vibrio splendidus]